MGKWWFNGGNGGLMGFTLWKFVTELWNIAIYSGFLQWIFPLKIVIFHSHVKLSEGTHAAKFQLETQV